MQEEHSNMDIKQEGPFLGNILDRPDIKLTEYTATENPTTEYPAFLIGMMLNLRSAADPTGY